LKTSKLVEYNILLKAFNINDILLTIKNNKTNFTNTLLNNSVSENVEGDINNINDAYNKLEEAYAELVTAKVNLQKNANDILLENEKMDLKESIKRYSNIPIPKSGKIKFVEENLTTGKDDESNKALIARIRRYVSVNQPTVVIRPSNTALIDPFISATPLYMLDEELLLLDNVKKRYNTVFHQRVQYRIINEASNAKLTAILPKNQINFMFINDYFNTRPIEVIQDYLKEVYKVLRPGGVVMFTYNNVDITRSAKNFEAGVGSYAPLHLLLPIATTLGFQVLKTMDTKLNISWMELKKPGKSISIKHGEALAEIIKPKQ